MKVHVLSKFNDPLIICEEEYEMPILPAVKKADIESLIPWNPNNKDYNGTLHFWIDDYKFNSMVTYPKRYIPIVQRYTNVIQPDHSSYGNWNYNIQRHQQYLRQWVGALWARRGKVTVVPNIHLPPNNEDKWNFFWAGVPKKSIIAISGQQVSDHCKNNKEQEWFLHGFDTMMEKLKPLKVIYYGGSIEKLEDKWGDILVRFSRHSFIGQQSTHKKYTFKEEIEEWDKNQWEQDQWQDKQMPMEEQHKTLQHGQQRLQQEQHKVSKLNIMKLSQPWKQDTQKLYPKQNEKLYKTGQQFNSNIELGYQVNKLLVQKKPQLKNGLSCKPNTEWEYVKMNIMLKKFHFCQSHTQLKRLLHYWIIRLLQQESLLLYQQNQKKQDITNCLQQDLWYLPQAVLHQELFHQKFLKPIKTKETIIKKLDRHNHILKASSTKFKEWKPYNLYKDNKIIKEYKGILKKSHMPMVWEKQQEIYPEICIITEVLDSMEFPNYLQKTQVENIERSSMKKQYLSSEFPTLPNMVKELHIKEKQNLRFNIQLWKKNLMLLNILQNLKLQKFEHILLCQVKFHRECEKLYIKKLQNNNWHLTFIKKCQRKNFLNQFLHQNQGKFHNQVLKWNFIRKQHSLEEVAQNTLLSQSLKKHKNHHDMQIHGIFLEQEKNLYLENTKRHIKEQQKNKLDRIESKHKKQFKHTSEDKQKLPIKKLENLNNLQNKQQSLENSTQKSLQLQQSQVQLDYKKDKELNNMENQRHQYKNLKNSQESWRNLQEISPNLKPSKQNKEEQNYNNKLQKKQSGIKKKLINLNNKSINSKYCIIFTGFKDVINIYEYMLKEGYNITLIYLDTLWMFPEVRNYISSFDGIQSLQLNHRLNSLLIKRGWPSMRGGNKAWHLRELEDTVDKYLQSNNLIEVTPFDKKTKKTHINNRQKRNSKFIAPLLDNSIELEDSMFEEFNELGDIRDTCESHYLLPIKGLMYSSLRPKFELEYFYNKTQEYHAYYADVRPANSVEKIWGELIKMDGQIIKQPSYFTNYTTLLDFTYEFDGRKLDKPVIEYVEKYEKTGRQITMEEWRRSRIKKAIQQGNWMWALNHREKTKWYPVKPLEFSITGKTVKVITLEGKGFERYLPITNLYTKPSENYFGKVEV